MAPTRWRRSSSVFAYWREGRLVIEDYRTRTAIFADPLAMRLLDAFAGFCSADEAARQMPEFTPASVRRAVRQLADQGLLLREHSKSAADDEAFVAAWSHWLPHAGIMHSGTKNAPYTADAEQIDRI